MHTAVQKGTSHSAFSATATSLGLLEGTRSKSSEAGSGRPASAIGARTILAHPEALPMRDPENLAASGAEIDESDTEQSLDSSCVYFGHFALAVRADRSLRIVFDALDHDESIILARPPRQL